MHLSRLGGRKGGGIQVQDIDGLLGSLRLYLPAGDLEYKTKSEKRDTEKEGGEFLTENLLPYSV